MVLSEAEDVAAVKVSEAEDVAAVKVSPQNKNEACGPGATLNYSKIATVGGTPTTVREEFQSKGYVVLRSFYSPEEVREISHSLDVMEADASDPGWKYYDNAVTRVEKYTDTDRTGWKYQDGTEKVLTRIEKFLFNNLEVEGV